MPRRRGRNNRCQYTLLSSCGPLFLRRGPGHRILRDLVKKLNSDTGNRSHKAARDGFFVLGLRVLEWVNFGYKTLVMNGLHNINLWRSVDAICDRKQMRPEKLLPMHPLTGPSSLLEITNHPIAGPQNPFPDTWLSIKTLDKHEIAEP